MANPNPIQTKEFIAQHTGDLGKARKTFGVRFPPAIEAQLLAMADAYDFIRQATTDKLQPAASDLFAPGKLLKISRQRSIRSGSDDAIEIRAIVDNQIAYRFKSATGWEYAIEPLTKFEKLAAKGQIKEDKRKPSATG